MAVNFIGHPAVPLLNVVNGCNCLISAAHEIGFVSFFYNALIALSDAGLAGRLLPRCRELPEARRVMAVPGRGAADAALRSLFPHLARALGIGASSAPAVQLQNLSPVPS